LEIESETEGKVSGDKTYTYELQEGYNAELKKGSVKSENETLDDEYVNVSVENNIVKVTTSYYISEKGFGAGYSGDETLDLNINFSVLEIYPEEGALNLKLIYEGEEILSAGVLIDLEAPIQTASNFTITENVTANKTAELIIENLELTEAERAKLIETFGNNFSVNTTKAEIVKGRLIVRHELGDYWVEYSYKSSSPEIDASAETMISNGIKRWLKVLAKNLIENSEKQSEEEVSKLMNGYKIKDLENNETQTQEKTETTNETSATTSNETAEKIPETNATAEAVNETA